MSTHPRTSRSPRGVALAVIVVVLLVVVLVALGVWALRSAADSRSADQSTDHFVAQRGGFDITVLASGELAAAKQIEIKNKVDQRAIITEIIDEGVTVRKDDVLVRLNDDEILNKIKDAENQEISARNELESAVANLAIKQKERESDLSKAQLKIELAELALRAWEHGEVVSKQQDLQLRKLTADKEYERLAARFAESEKLKEQEFISLDEYKRDFIALMKAEVEVKQAELDIKVYQEYTHKKDRKTKESDLEQAQEEQERVVQRHDAEISRAESNVTSKRSHLENRTEMLEDLREQLSYCVITAPADGLVVYATSLERQRWRSDETLQVGTELYRNQLIIVLPDTSQMVADVKVNEALSGLITPGQQAVVTLDAAPDTVLSGEVVSIGVLAESGGWRDPNRRDYTVRVKLAGADDLALKPSMRCKAEVYVGSVQDAVHVPLQAVLREGPIAYVHVPASGGYAQREVKVGRSSELFVEITEGLEVGETVLLRAPQPAEVVSKLDISPEDLKRGPAPQEELAEAEPKQDRRGDGNRRRAERPHRSESDGKG